MFSKIRQAGSRSAQPPAASPHEDPGISPRQRTRTQLFTARRGGKLPITSFHGTGVPPSVIFKEGLTALHPIDVDPDDEALWQRALHDHAIGNEDGSSMAWRTGCEFLGCRFVSTSKDPNLSMKFALGLFQTVPDIRFNNDEAYVYEVDMRAVQEKKIPFADMNRTLGQDSPYRPDYEISALTHIPPEVIMHAFPVKKGTETHRPHLDDFGPAIRNATYRPDEPQLATATGTLATDSEEREIK